MKTDENELKSTHVNDVRMIDRSNSKSHNSHTEKCGDTCDPRKFYTDNFFNLSLSLNPNIIELNPSF